MLPNTASRTGIDRLSKFLHQHKIAQKETKHRKFTRQLDGYAKMKNLLVRDLGSPTHIFRA
jgi:hypothetical protein